MKGNKSMHNIRAIEQETVNIIRIYKHTVYLKVSCQVCREKEGALQTAFSWVVGGWQGERFESINERVMKLNFFQKVCLHSSSLKQGIFFSITQA